MNLCQSPIILWSLRQHINDWISSWLLIFIKFLCVVLFFCAKMKNISHNFKVLTSVAKGKSKSGKLLFGWALPVSYITWIYSLTILYIPTSCLFIRPLLLTFTHFIPSSYQVTSHMVKVFSPGSADKPSNENSLRRKGFIWLHLQVKVRILERYSRNKLKQRPWKNPASCLASHIFFHLNSHTNKNYLPTVGYVLQH